MSFISYAQNMEDYLLWRALKDVKQGFYVDVGANDPEVDSVTKSFYDKGWRGVNIEPFALAFQKLAKERPDDTNINCAVSDKSGEVTFFERTSECGLSTCDPKIANMHRENGIAFLEKKIAAFTLNDLLRPFSGKEIHFLKIDVEGFEKQVLQGLDFSKHRPWIVVVEATIPLSQTQSYQGWEHLLVLAKYDFVFFDGLSRYYVACERENLKKAFSQPISLFDDVETIGEKRLREKAARADALHETNANLSASVMKKEDEIKQLNARIAEQQTALDSLNASLKEKQDACARLKERIDANEMETKRLDAVASSANAENERLRVQVANAENALHQAEILRERILAEKALLERMDDALRRENQRMQENASDAVARARELSLRNRALEQQASDLQSTDAALRADLRSVTETKGRLEWELSEARRIQQEQVAQLSSALSNEDDVRRRLGETENALRHAHETLARRESEINAANAEKNRQTAFANKNVAEVRRLRNLLYSASIGKHLYRAWMVFWGYKHYCQDASAIPAASQATKSSSSPKPPRPLKRYTHLHVPWHTHLYRAALALFVRGEKPWHTHIYRCWQSMRGNERYRPFSEKEMNDVGPLPYLLPNAGRIYFLLTEKQDTQA
jgi:FkbM family methyltransferase